MQMTYLILYLADVQVQAQEGVIHVVLECGILEDVSREDGLEISIESRCPEEISRKKGKSHNCMIRSIISGSLHHTSHDIWIIILSILRWSRQRLILQGNNSPVFRWIDFSRRMRCNCAYNFYEIYNIFEFKNEFLK